MPAYTYRAITAQGDEKQGILEADTERQLRQQLRQQGLLPLQLALVTEKAAVNKILALPTRRQRLPINDLALLTRQLATLLAAGLPIAEALLAIAEQADKAKVKHLIMAVRGKVLEGHSLAAAMANFPSAFSNLYRATVAAGEQTGKLDAVLERLADYNEQQQIIQQKIQHALLYPSLMLVVALAIVSFLLMSVVPKIVGIFSNSGQALPILTQLLLNISGFVQQAGIYLIFILAGAIIYWRYLLRTRETLRYRAHLFLLRLPLLGRTIKIVNTARFARTLGILSSSGVDVLEAMRVSTQVISNLPIKQAVMEANTKVREGSSMHRALQQTNYFSPMSIHLIASGESSGQLEAMLSRVADNQDRAVLQLIETSLTLFEPLLILLMGAVVLFIVLAILLPIFSLDQMVG